MPRGVGAAAGNISTGSRGSRDVDYKQAGDTGPDMGLQLKSSQSA
jgi:hypothetical protein